MNIQNDRRALVKSLHYISGVTLSVFIAFHLLNHLFALDRPEKHIQFMDQFRLVYRHPVVETLLLLVVLLQIVTGIRLIYKRDAQAIAEKIQVCSGLYLSFFLIAHVGAVLSARYIEHLDTNFYFAAAGLNYYPATFIFIPYYFLAVASISLHVSAIHYLKTKSKRAAVGIAVVGIVTSFMIILAFTDNFKWLDMPLRYEQFIRALI